MASPYKPATTSGIGWNPASQFESMDDWLHQRGDRSYKERRKLANAAMKRAEELAAAEYPVSADNYIRTKMKGERKAAHRKKLRKYAKEGRERMARTGKSGKTKGPWMAAVRAIQLNILSNLIMREGPNPDIVSIRDAGMEHAEEIEVIVERTRTTGLARLGTTGATTVGRIGWTPKSKFKSLSAWLNEDKKAYYKERKSLADMAMERAEEMAAVEYPISAERDKKYKHKLKTFIKIGKDRLKRTGKSGKAKGKWMAAVRDIQLNILSHLIAEHGPHPDPIDVRCAGYRGEGESRLPCPPYQPRKFDPERTVGLMGRCRPEEMSAQERREGRAWCVYKEDPVDKSRAMRPQPKYWPQHFKSEADADKAEQDMHIFGDNPGYVSGQKTVGAIGWNKKSGFKSMDDWLHTHGDQYYDKRRKIADLAMERAEELAAIQYPLSADKYIKKKKGKDDTRRLKKFVKLGKERMKRNKTDGKAKGDWFRAVRAIQLNILSNIIGEQGPTPNEADVRCAGLDETGDIQVPCPAYKKTTGWMPVVPASFDSGLGEGRWRPNEGPRCYEQPSNARLIVGNSPISAPQGEAYFVQVYHQPTVGGPKDKMRGAEAAWGGSMQVNGLTVGGTRSGQLPLSAVTDIPSLGTAMTVKGIMKKYVDEHLQPYSGGVYDVVVERGKSSTTG